MTRSALRNIHNGWSVTRFDKLVEPHLFQITYDALANAIDLGYGTVAYNLPTRAFVDQLKTSVAHFAARKSYQQAKDLAALLDKNGTRRPWPEFKKLAKPIVGNYNERWLKTEYDTGSRAARMAQKFQKWEQAKHLYPNLKYLPSRAATPRQEHKPYYGLVRPIDDVFWNTHLPPSAFNCQCSVEQSDESVTAIPEGPAPEPGLANNPARSGQLFDNDASGYSQNLNDHQQTAIDEAGVKQQLKLARTTTLEAVTRQILERDIAIEREEIGQIDFTRKGLKEAINQPHRHYLAKLDLIANDLIDVMLKAEYVGVHPNTKPDKKPHIKAYHYFTFTLAGDPSYVVVEESIQGKFTLYTIADTQK
ncbi:LPD3 domain-containing protein [Spirosoma aerolatum]|uniref:LPD3 domain-containing protein n=1 Tax=Spirosoma aerolatum TaxID=1211326 RepID=UPI0014737F33|nr:phage minor head protein [Spirosoma aerolatum]